MFLFIIQFFYLCFNVFLFLMRLSCACVCSYFVIWPHKTYTQWIPEVEAIKPCIKYFQCENVYKWIKINNISHLLTTRHCWTFKIEVPSFFFSAIKINSIDDCWLHNFLSTCLFHEIIWNALLHASNYISFSSVLCWKFAWKV